SDHSLTLCSQQLFGSASMTGAAQSSGQPQSQTITFASGFTRGTPSSTARLTPETISAPVRFAHRGQSCWRKWDAQFVRFSEAVIVNTPARSGTAATTGARDSEDHARARARGA